MSALVASLGEIIFVRTAKLDGSFRIYIEAPAADVTELARVRTISSERQKAAVLVRCDQLPPADGRQGTELSTGTAPTEAPHRAAGPEGPAAGNTQPEASGTCRHQHRLGSRRGGIK